jgi:hypothetical protein
MSHVISFGYVLKLVCHDPVKKWQAALVLPQADRDLETRLRRLARGLIIDSSLFSVAVFVWAALSGLGWSALPRPRPMAWAGAKSRRWRWRQKPCCLDFSSEMKRAEGKFIVGAT